MLRPLMMMRTRGLMGPVAHGFANLKGHLAKSAGQFQGVTGAGSVPVWSAIPDTDVSQGGSWPLQLSDYVTSESPVTFTITGGALPVGITMTSDGKFTGTVTDLAGSGTVTYTATNLAGATESGIHTWTIPGAPP